MVIRETQACEVLDESALSAEELARACGVEVAWVRERVDAGVLQVRTVEAGGWRFDSATLVRARRVVRLESAFDADPQLAALTVDLMEEVDRLRRRLGMPGLDRR